MGRNRMRWVGMRWAGMGMDVVVCCEMNKKLLVVRARRERGGIWYAVMEWDGWSFV